MKKTAKKKRAKSLSILPKLKVPKLHLIAENTGNFECCSYIQISNGTAIATNNFVLVGINLEPFHCLSQLPNCLIHRSEWEKIAGLETKQRSITIDTDKNEILFSNRRKVIPVKFNSNPSIHFPNTEEITPPAIHNKSGGPQVVIVNFARLQSILKIFDILENKKVEIRIQICENEENSESKKTVDKVRLDFVKDGWIYLGYALMPFTRDDESRSCWRLTYKQDNQHS